MAFIDKSYFIGELNLPRTSNALVEERLTHFIEKYETDLLEKILGFELYAAFIAGVQEDTIEQRWTDLLFGTTYCDGKHRWKGLVWLSSGVTTNLLAAGNTPVIVGGGNTYDPAPETYAVTVPPQYVGRPFGFFQRGVGELVRGTEYSVNGNVLLLLQDGVFSIGDTYFYSAGYSLEIVGTSTAKRSLIANYVYYWWLRDNVSHTATIGESQPQAENATAVSPGQKMCRAWNEMAQWIKELTHFLDHSQNTYPEWNAYTGYCNLKSFKLISTMI